MPLAVAVVRAVLPPSTKRTVFNFRRSAVFPALIIAVGVLRRNDRRRLLLLLLALLELRFAVCRITMVAFVFAFVFADDDCVGER